MLSGEFGHLMLLWEDLNKRSAIFVTIGPLNWTFGDLGYGFILYLDSGLSVILEASPFFHSDHC